MVYLNIRWSHRASLEDTSSRLLLLPCKHHSTDLLNLASEVTRNCQLSSESTCQDVLSQQSQKDQACPISLLIKSGFVIAINTNMVYWFGIIEDLKTPAMYDNVRLKVYYTIERGSPPNSLSKIVQQQW